MKDNPKTHEGRVTADSPTKRLFVEAVVIEVQKVEFQVYFPTDC